MIVLDRVYWAIFGIKLTADWFSKCVP